MPLFISERRRENSHFIYSFSQWNDSYLSRFAVKSSSCPFVLYLPLFDSPAVASISYDIVGIAKTLKMDVSRQASHPISPISGTSQASDIAVDPMAVQWKLVQERANQTLVELLLLVLFVVRSIIQFLRSVVGDQVIFSLSPAQGEPTFTPARSPPAPLPSPSPCPPVSKAVRSPQVLSINTLGLEPSQSPPSPPSLTDRELLELANKPVSTYRELLELLNLPENLDSIKLLAEYGLVPDDTLLELGLLPNHTSLEPSPSPPLSPVVPSSPPYVPPQLRTAAASSAPSHISRQAPASSASSAAPRQSPAPPASASPAPASSLGPPFVSYVKIEKGCFYCHNKHPSGLRHTHRNHCPWFHHHLAVGTCHLNDRGELCLGPKRALAQPLPFWSSTVSQGEQVKRRTDGTEWDEVVERRVWNPVVFRSGSVLVERQNGSHNSGVEYVRSH